ncbi:hypothetical protein Nepgr_026112 [Nepenthes gracilis]|uniref:NAC domain-containing protein n=1 Tax=Nepenthes gracilis TaxID=150966 RepID=A0AAD3Y1S5_NEPGR|nr:hypothetical protein Nepgr_026112 [Nepenthes gracilis]
MKKTLVFYRGRAPTGEKSHWVMQEFRLDGKLAYHYFSRNFKGAPKERHWPSCHRWMRWHSDRLFSPSMAAAADRDSCSYDGEEVAANGEHVSCFSTIINADSSSSAYSAFNHHTSNFPGLISPPPSFFFSNGRPRNSGLPAFPQENLQLPSFSPMPPDGVGNGGGGTGDPMEAFRFMGSWAGIVEERKL